MMELFHQAWQALFTCDPRWVLAAFVLYNFNLFLIGLRWKITISALGGKARVLETSLATIAGSFINNITPASRLGGEVCRIALITNRENVDIKIATISSVYDRIIEAIPVVFIVLFAMPIFYSMILQIEASLLWVLVPLAFAVGFWLLVRKADRIRERVRGVFERVRKYRISRRVFLINFGLSTLIWFEDILRVYVVSLAFGIHLDVVQASALVALTVFAGLVPTIGGLGAIEGGLIGGYLFFGVPIEQALAATALERSISYLFATGFGGLSFFFLGGKKIWRRLKQKKISTLPLQDEPSQA